MQPPSGWQQAPLGGGHPAAGGQASASNQVPERLRQALRVSSAVQPPSGSQQAPVATVAVLDSPGVMASGVQVQMPPLGNLWMAPS